MVTTVFVGVLIISIILLVMYKYREHIREFINKKEDSNRVSNFCKDLDNSFRIINEHLKEKHGYYKLNTETYRNNRKTHDSDALNVLRMLVDLEKIMRHNPTGFKSVEVIYSDTIRQIKDNLVVAENMLLLNDNSLYLEITEVLNEIMQTVDKIKSKELKKVEGNIGIEKDFVKSMREKIY